jgi:hypothetical protein
MCGVDGTAAAGHIPTGSPVGQERPTQVPANVAVLDSASAAQRSMSSLVNVAIQYVNGRLEPSEPTVSLLLVGDGRHHPDHMARSKWSTPSCAVGNYTEPSAWREHAHAQDLWARMQRNLDRVRDYSQGEPHVRNMTLAEDD